MAVEGGIEVGVGNDSVPRDSRHPNILDLFSSRVLGLTLSRQRKGCSIIMVAVIGVANDRSVVRPEIYSRTMVETDQLERIQASATLS